MPTRRHAPDPGRSLPAAIAAFAADTAGRGNWGHTGLAAMLKTIDVAEARWTPGPDVFSIWKEVNHIIYWSQYVLEWLEGRGRRAKQAWPAAEGGAPEWRRTAREASRLHLKLARRVRTLKPAALANRHLRSRYSYVQIVLGCAAHVSYHTGRIALLRKMYQERAA